MRQILFSIDVESDGPIPGHNSMLNFGCAAFLPSNLPSNEDLRLMDDVPVATFSANLQVLRGAVADPDTMAWWAKQPVAWANVRSELQDPADVMPNFVAWVDQVVLGCGGARKVCCAYPAGYDWTFLYWYMIKFARRSPFGFSCLDAKTLAMAKLGCTFHAASKKNFPKEWFDGGGEHTHRGIDDAVEQGRMIMRMLRWRPQS